MGRACSKNGGKKRNIQMALLEEPEGKRPFGKHRRRWEDNIKMDFKETGIRAAE
jgi:hypothetical protein